MFIVNSKNNQIKQKIDLKFESFLDALYLNNKLILCGVNKKMDEIKIIEFDENSSFNLKKHFKTLLKNLSFNSVFAMCPKVNSIFKWIVLSSFFIFTLSYLLIIYV